MNPITLTIRLPKACNPNARSPKRNPMKLRANTGTSVEEKIAQRTIVSESCWEWSGSRTSSGYPTVSAVRAKRMLLVSRVLLARKLGRELAPAPIECACHTCDNPRCVNPNHLFLGTHAENMKDMEAKQRASHPAGEKHGRAKLTADQVRQIATATGSSTKIGAEFGVHSSTVCRIRRGEIWKGDCK